MTRKFLLATFLLLAGPGVLAETDNDRQAAAELKVILQKWVDDYNKLDADGMNAPIADALWGGSWDLDMAMQPATWASTAEKKKFFIDAVTMLKTLGAKVDVQTQKSDCKASGTLGVCFWEGTQGFAIPGMPPFTMSLHTTEVFEKQKDGSWKFVYHHGAPTKNLMPTASVAATSKANAGWVDGGMPGVKALPLWMNPTNLNSATFLKATKTLSQPRQILLHPVTFTVLEGTLITSDAAGKDVVYGPGSVIYRAAHEPHRTTLKQGAVIFMVAHGPLQTLPVDEKGVPLQQAAK
jgi:ketosteroid isomerase-like protein